MEWNGTEWNELMMDCCYVVVVVYLLLCVVFVMCFMF